MEWRDLVVAPHLARLVRVPARTAGAAGKHVPAARFLGSLLNTSRALGMTLRGTVVEHVGIVLSHLNSHKNQ